MQIKKREQQNQGDQQQIRPPFQENFVEDEETIEDQDQIHYFGEEEDNLFLKKEEQDLFFLARIRNHAYGIKISQEGVSK